MTFLNNLEKVAIARYEIANSLTKIAETLTEAEKEGESSSGKLSLDTNIEDINFASNNLRNGVFRLLVLGDLKRGKSTFLNALIGENLLPSDVNPCTALLTVLRYGISKQVTVYFKDGKVSEKLDFDTFKQRYTIDPGEAKQLEQSDRLAFPDVDYAVVEYPLPLLEKGIEIIDSPGLNDTEARNKLSLSYINNCHAILFIFRAVQPCTLEERRYLENFIKGRGLSVFFLINAWDEVRQELIDPDNAEELQQAKKKLRQVFRSNLTEYCLVDGQDIYQERVFEISSLMALRKRIKNSEDNLQGTGFPEFTKALNTFLTQERAIAEFRQARTLAQQAYIQTHEAIVRRLPLLEDDVRELKEKVNSVEPEFKQLNDIRDRFHNEIKNTRDRKAKEIANSFREYVLNLGNTFEEDFVRYQPDLGFLNFLSQDRREAFNNSFKQAFERYITEKISAWEISAERDLEKAFSHLAQTAADYGEIFSKVTNAIDEKLIGKKIYFTGNLEDNNSPGWAKWA
ncbi:MAG: dynamin family protein, partial [Xenococcaceae cyanobacterium]